MTDEILSAGLDYAGKGWKVFPVDRISKAPLVGGGFKSASNDPDVIRAWWDEFPDANVAAPVPDVWVVLDVDPRSGGDTSWQDLQNSYGAAPETLTGLTGGGGLHLFWEHPGGALRQTAGLLGPGLDSRLPGKGYIVLPPSLHASGQRYSWLDGDAPAVAMPRWLVQLLRPPVPSPHQYDPRPTRHADRYVEAAISGEVANIVSAPVGRRNDIIHKASVKLGSLIGAGVLREADAVDALLDACHASGYVADDGRSQALKTIRSGLQFGIAHPRVMTR
jgi:hypothetical protein